jgi:hypothetical protein
LRANSKPDTVQPDLRANPTPDHVQPDLRANSQIVIFQPETRATSPTPGTQTEQYYAVDIYVNFSHQISRTLERIQFILNESKIQKCTSVKIAEILMTLEQKTNLLTSLRQVNFAMLDQAVSHLHQFRIRVEAIDVKSNELKVRLEIPAWEKIITILKAGTANRAVKFYPPCITIKTSKPKRVFFTKTTRIIQEQSPGTCSLLIMRSELDRYPDTVDLPHGNTDLACVAKYHDELLDTIQKQNFPTTQA